MKFSTNNNSRTSSMSNHKHTSGKADISLEQYIEAYTSPEDELLRDLRRQTHLKVLRPRMVSGPVQGQLLTMLCRMFRPSLALEIGTFTGYSAICMARGMDAGTKLHTVERDDELEPFIRSYLHKANLENQVTLHIGDALEVLNGFEQVFDFVFIDGDKREYPAYYKAIIDRTRPGGIIIADNILWNGKVTELPEPGDEYTKGILDFNEMVKNDPRTEQVILPIRDGLMMIRVK